MIEATPWGQQPSYLIHDRDRVYGADFATRSAGRERLVRSRAVVREDSLADLIHEDR